MVGHSSSGYDDFEEAGQIPPKLKYDSILEAIFELRFDCKDLPEVTIGRLVDHTPWEAFTKSRTAISDIPAALRLSDPHLRYQPILELKQEGGPLTVKIGTNAISFHNVRPYAGWSEFYRNLSDLTQMLFNKLDQLNVRRLGLRYVNALEAKSHLINDISVLNISLSLKNCPITHNFNVNYRHKVSPNAVCLTRVATIDFVEGPPLPDDTAAYVDIDVFTPTIFRTDRLHEVQRWLENARLYKNAAFFKLIPREIIDKIKEK